MMNKIYNSLHIVLYLSYDCNLRCSYCVINFSKEIITFKTIDFIIDFVIYNQNNFDYIFIEFIWWEPLLQVDSIKYFLSKNLTNNIKFQITTNWTIVNTNIYYDIINKVDIVNLSYNENYFNSNILFEKISKILLDKSNISINFIYNPKNNIEDIKNNFLFIVKCWYRKINILPIVLVYNYSKQDFLQLIEFINFISWFRKYIKLEFLYYIQEKNWHFEITVDPNWNILWDNMWTAEEYFWVKSKLNNSIWKIGELTLEKIEKKLKDYTYTKYLKNIIQKWKTNQSYDNLLVLSNLLKKYDDRV